MPGLLPDRDARGITHADLVIQAGHSTMARPQTGDFMELITHAYRDLNSQLHRAEETYGAGSYRWSETVLSLRAELGADTVLDYGCGKGMLRRSLGKPAWIAEYDPAIPGKNGEPAQADLAVCSDVLEHIERDCLINVLEHLRQKAKRGLFLVIATRPSSRTLADGRNAHLIIEDGAWWKAQLERFFKIHSWHSDGNEVVVVVRRLHQIGDIKVISAVSDSIRFEQARINSVKCPRRLAILPVHDRAVTIACYGPSLAQTWPQIAVERARGNLVLSVSGAHDFLIARGIVPDIHVDVDPREHKGFFTKNPNPAVKYWMASCCHPSVIDNLIPYDLTLWHVLNSDEDHRIYHELERDAWLLAGGGSVGCRAVNLMYTQGFRRFSIHGMDCSFADDGEQHAGAHSGKVQQEWEATCGGKRFRTSGTLIAIASAFLQNMTVLEERSRGDGDPVVIEGDCIETILHGGGMLSAMAGGPPPAIDPPLKLEACA